MKRRRSASLRNRHRGRPALVGGLAAAILATGGFATSTVASASTSHITLTVLDGYGPGSGSQYTAIQWIFQQYEKTHPQVTISAQAVTDTIQKVLAEASTNTLPDLYLSDPTYLASFMGTGDWVNLKPLLIKWGQMKDYLAGTWPQATYKGGIYGIDDGLNDPGFIYNKKIFAEAGITSVPTTWSQLLSDSKAIVTKVKGLTYGAVGYSAANNGCSATWQFLPWIYQQGLDINDLNSPGVAAALNFWDTLLKDGYANKEVITECQNVITQLIEGKLAMEETGQWDFPTLAAAHFTDWGTFQIPLRSPSDHPAVPMGGEYWTIPKTTAASETAAWNFVEWAQQPSIAMEFDLKQDYTPTRTSLWPAFEKISPQATPFVNELKYAIGRTTALGLKFPAYGNALGTAIVQVLEGEKSTTSALAAALTAAKNTLSSQGQ